MKYIEFSLLCLLFVGCSPAQFSSIPLSTDNIGGGGGGTITPPACTTSSSSNTPVLTSLPSGVTQAMIQSICPALGKDSECGAVLIIQNSGVSIYFTGQGPYDGNDDTLVGILNLSSTTINDIALNSNADIMGFDGDGIDGYQSDGIAGNSMDVSNAPSFCQSLGTSANSATECGYGGPNAYFTNLVPGCPEMDQNLQCTSGTVNFITPVAPSGGTTYFSLENSLGNGSTCISTLTN